MFFHCIESSSVQNFICAYFINHSLPEVGNVFLGECELCAPGQVLRKQAGEHPAVRTIYLLRNILGYDLLPFRQVQLSLLLDPMLLAQIIREPSQSSLVVYTHAVVICDGLGSHVQGCEAPVQAQVDRDQHQAVGEQIHLAGPPLHSGVPPGH